MNIKKGDTVKVLYGKDSGKNGVVLSVLAKLDKVLVGGINKVTKHIKGDGKKRKSEIVSIERPMPASKVMLVCTNCNKPTRVTTLRKGSGYVRVCKKCNKEFKSLGTSVKEDKKIESKVEDKETKTKSSKKK